MKLPDNSDTACLIRADWLEDHDQAAEARELREEVAEGPNVVGADFGGLGGFNGVCGVGGIFGGEVGGGLSGGGVGGDIGVGGIGGEITSVGVGSDIGVGGIGGVGGGVHSSGIGGGSGRRRRRPQRHR